MIAVCVVVDKSISIVTLLGELAYGDSQPSSTTVHTTGGREAYIPLSLCYATWHPMTTTIHHWWKGNIYSIVTVQGDIAPGDRHPYTIGGRETYIPLSLCYATWHPMTTTIHHWWKGNIYSIVTVLRDLAPDDNNHTPLVEGKHIFHCHSARRHSTR